MSEFKLIVAGSRGFTNYRVLSKILFELADGMYADKAISIVSGMARGADQLAIQFARSNGVKLYEFPALWDIHGKSAGFIRNKEMGRIADGLVAFWDGKSRGTQHMIDFMLGLNKPVHVVKYGPMTFNELTQGEAA
jgi:hypothetical protein